MNRQLIDSLLTDRNARLVYETLERSGPLSENQLYQVLKDKMAKGTLRDRVAYLLGERVGLVLEEKGSRKAKILSVKDSESTKIIRDYWTNQFLVLEDRISRAGYIMNRMLSSKGADRTRFLLLELLDILELVDHEVIRGMQFQWLERNGHVRTRRLSELEEVVGETIDKLFDRILNKVGKEEFEIALANLLRLRRAQRQLLLKDPRLVAQLATSYPSSPRRESLNTEERLLGLTPREIKAHFEKLLDEKLSVPTNNSASAGS